MDTPLPPLPQVQSWRARGRLRSKCNSSGPPPTLSMGGEGEGHRQVNATRVFAIFFRGLYEAPPLHGNAVKLLKLT